MKSKTLGGIAFVIAILSLALNAYLLYDKSKTYNEQKQSSLFASFDSLMNAYCTNTSRSSEAEMISLAKTLPGAENAKVEEEDGKRKLVVGYNTGSGWADVREALDCSSR